MRGFPGGTDGKEPTCHAGVTRDVGLIPGREGRLGQGLAAHSSILAWGIPWTEESGSLQSMGSKESDTT